MKGYMIPPKKIHLTEIAKECRGRIYSPWWVQRQVDRVNEKYSTEYTVEQVMEYLEGQKDGVLGLQRLENKLKDLKNENTWLKNNLLKQEDMLGELSEIVTSFPSVENNYSSPKYEKTVTENAVFCFSDPHYGEIVNPKVLVPPLYENGSQKDYPIVKPWMLGYNLEIALRRSEVYVDKALWLVDLERKERNINTGYFFGLCDYISGKIHKELERNQSHHVMMQTGIAGWIMARMIHELAQNFEQLYVFLLGAGNHGRDDVKPYAKDKATYNFDYMAAQICSLYLKNCLNIKINIPQSPVAIVRIEDWNFMLTHGDGGGKGSYGGIPWYGINRFTKDWESIMSELSTPIHRVIMGHYHTDANVPGDIMCGSLKGGDEFSMYGIRKISEPSQRIFGVHKDRPESWSRVIDFADIDSPTKPLRYILPENSEWSEWPLE